MTKIGYFIRPEITPLSRINFTALKAKGISEVYIRATNGGTTAFTNLNTYYSQIVGAGLKPYAWVWQGFSHSKEVTDMGFHTVLDLETYEIEGYLPEVKQMREDTRGKTFIVCTKPDEWDGDQRWDLLAPLCDYLMPMLYVGDYHKSIPQLGDVTKRYDGKYPGMIYPAIETYVSDENPIPKGNNVVQAEISAIRSYVGGVALFRYGLGEYE